MSRRPNPQPLFARTEFDRHLEQLRLYIRQKVLSIPRAAVLGEAEPKLLASLHAQYEESPFHLHIDRTYRLEPTDVLVNSSLLTNHPDQRREVDLTGTLHTFVVPFVGGLHYLDMHPSWMGGRLYGELHLPQTIDAGTPIHGELHFPYECVEATPAEIRSELAHDLDDVKRMLETMTNLAGEFNKQLMPLLTAALQERREKVLKDASTADALGIPLRQREGAPKPFSIPVREKIKLVQPATVSQSAKEEWTLQETNYEMILWVLRDLGQSIQRTASAFAAMEEEHLRDIILLVLNGHFEGTATGETFNARGKSDILMRWRGRNAFIAECKFWRGPAFFLKGIKQLKRYTCWSDTKATLLILNRNRSMTHVVAAIRDLMSAHPNLKGTVERRNDNEFRCMLEHPEDKRALLTVTLLVYHVPRGTSRRDDSQRARRAKAVPSASS